MMRSSRRKSAMPSPGTTEAFLSNKRKKTVGSSLLSDDMMIEVLLRLPVKPIIRFRAVCRAWAALLSSKEFCSLHMAINKAAPAQLKLLHVSHTSRFDSSAVYSCSPSGHKDDLLFTLDHARRHSSVEVLTPAPCRGLTLLHDPASLAYCICNASTRAVTRLPPYRKVVHFSTAGLGFDSRTREYKVVRLFNDMGTAKCDVYTLGGGGRWRPAAGGIPFRLCKAANSAVQNAAVHASLPALANGFLHWLVDPFILITRPRTGIISFSVTDETFTSVRAPPFVVPLHDYFPMYRAGWTPGEHLAELDNQLCMVRDRRGNPYGSTWEIWKLLDYGAGDWSLNHSIDLSGHVGRELRDPQIVRVICSVGECMSEKKMIIIATSEHQVHEKFQKKVHTYDPRSGALKTILSITETHTSLEDSPVSMRFGLIQESLAPVHEEVKRII